MRMACTALSMVPWAVTRITAIVVACSARCPSSSMPPMRGIFRSVMTIEGDHCVALSRPSAPSRAVSTRKPQEDTSSASPDRSFSSSSTISIFSWLIGLLLLQVFASVTLPSNPRIEPPIRSNPNDTRPASRPARSVCSHPRQARGCPFGISL